MAFSTVVKSTASVGTIPGISLPSWGRSFWQDPNDGEIFLAYASGNKEVDYVTSADSGITWESPQLLFSCDDFSQADNFDTLMTPDGDIHCVFQFQSSGCYKYIKKETGGGWTTASGDGTVSFVATSTVGPSGIHASLLYSPGPLGSDISATYPIIRIACKTSENDMKAYYVQNPWKTAVKEDSGMHDMGASPPGTEGGYPVWGVAHASFPTNRAVSIAYATHSGTIIYGTRGFGFWGIWNETKTGIFVNNLVDQGSGSYPFGKCMAFASGTVSTSPNMSNNWPILVAHESGIEGYCMGSEPQGNGAFFSRMDSTYVGTNGSHLRAPDGFPIGNIASGIKGAVNGGTNVDISWANEPGVMLFYFQDLDNNGVQRISRIKATPAWQNVKGGVTNTSSFTEWRFSDLVHPISGLVSESMVWTDYCGQDISEVGNRHFSFWRGFKALRHPVDQNTGLVKNEIVVTVGDSIQPSGTTRLIAWDFDKSVRATESFAAPTYEFLLTTPPSGSNRVFVGVADHSIGVFDNELVEKLFDGKTSTFVTPSTNDHITIEFIEPVTITRLELLFKRSAISATLGPYTVLASLDNQDFREIITTGSDTGAINGESISKIVADRTVEIRDDDIHQTFRMDAFVAKYVKFKFGTVTGTFRQIKVYGPHTTSGRTLTGLDAGAGFTAWEQRFELASPVVKIAPTENFNLYREGEIPPKWRTYGDWEWFVRASGDYSRTSRLTPVPPQDGKQHGGVFDGIGNGLGDGFCMRTVEGGAPKNTSGVLEVDVNVATDELNNSDVPGRTISFSTRYDLAGSGLLNGPEDDAFSIHTISNGVETEIQDYWVQGNCWINKCDWYTVSFTVPTGLSTIRWIYDRGDADFANVPVGERGIVWIDRIEGLDGVSTTAINGFLIGNNSEVSPTGIYGYLEGLMSETIYAYMLGEITFPSINGYVSVITSGTDSENTHAYLPAQYMFASGAINSFLKAGFASGTINSYLLGGIDASGSILSYIKTTEADQFINGYMNTLSSTTGSINTYIKVADADSSINVYVAVNEAGIHGYLRATIDGQFINCYLLNTGVSGAINAYMNTNENEQINAYLAGHTFASGGINTYMNTIASQQINGYIAGISGTGSGSINAYMSAVLVPDSQINAYLIAVQDDICACHGSVPLPALPTYTLPSSIFNNAI